MSERIDGIPASEYSALHELQGRVDAALVYIDMSDFVDKNIVTSILRGRGEKTEECDND